MSITEFLMARISEDEAVARAAVEGIHGEHESSRDYAGYVLSSERDTTEAQDEFIETFWPARVIAECAAKRAMVASCGMAPGYEYDPATKLRDDILRTLAAVYADHPAYLDKWRVGA